MPWTEETLHDRMCFNMCLQLQKTAAAPGVNPLLSAATAKAAQIAASFGLPVSVPSQAPAPYAPVGLGGVAPGAAAFRPAPLRLDAAGREVDEKGNVVARPVQVGEQYYREQCAGR